MDLACGSGPVLRRLSRRRAVGIDRSGGELTRARASSDGPSRLVRADAAAVPLASGIADAVVASMALMVLPSLTDVLAEVARVLRPRGVFVATVPTRSSAGLSREFTELLALLGQTSRRYPQPLDPASAESRFAEAGLDLADDAMGRFVRRVSSTDEAELVVRSFYTPGTSAERVGDAVQWLGRRLAAGPVEVCYPIRRLVASRTSTRPSASRTARHG
jgi:SAM-dependent methyltransferase